MVVEAYDFRVEGCWCDVTLIVRAKYWLNSWLGHADPAVAAVAVRRVGSARSALYHRLMDSAQCLLTAPFDLTVHYPCFASTCLSGLHWSVPGLAFANVDHKQAALQQFL